MQNILDAIQSGSATSEDFASLELPESYRAAFVKKEEVDDPKNWMGEMAPDFRLPATTRYGPLKENVTLAQNAASSLGKIVESATRSFEMATRISRALAEQSQASRRR